MLAKRRDYPLWDLPGGTLEKGEDTAICAIREAEEETGYIISIKRKIGEYYKPQYNDTEHLFLGVLVGGSPIDGGPETEEVKWFHPCKLPFYMIPNRRKQIRNYIKYKGEIVEKSLKVSPAKIFFLKGFLKAFGRFL